ncbi:radical SAM protein [Pontiella sp.]|uniref:radical SAM protein n=1 Tax=Pontiella sp. TaxID=2837462 RepID=UPI0035655E49
MKKNFHYLFGPVPSRRLGRSLGVDLIPFKTCTMNCTYCQLGETTCEVNERGDYVPMQDVLAELDAWNKRDGQADHITLAGSGEPTLHRHFGDVFRWVKENTGIPSVLLTNGTLLHSAEVREDAALADKVKVTLSAWDEASFQQIHRPAQGVTFELLVKGERAFRSTYLGELSVEVFIIEGVNSQVASVKKIAEVVRSLNPDRIDINTAVRPPADPSVKAASQGHLQALAELFGPTASVTASFKKQGFEALEISEEALLGLIKRHPATCAQLAADFNYPGDKMFKTLKAMVAAGLLREDKSGGETYFFHRA